MPASPRRPSFRERFMELVAEYEELQARCDTLAADNRDLQEKLLAAEGRARSRDRDRDALSPLPPVATVTTYSTDQDKDRDGGRDALAIEDKEGKDGRKGRDDRDDREDRDDRDRKDTRAADRGAERDSRKDSGRAAQRSGGDGGGGSDDESSSGSSSGSEGSRDHDHHSRRRRKHRRRHSRGGHRRRRRHGGSRSRSGRSRSRRGKRSSPGRGGGSGLVARGLYGSGDHRRDVEDFCHKNQLEARVIAALKSMPESKQRKVMGTDGGENSYLLIDRVKNPNAVVMSRIRKIEAEM